jgi:hypothetical protein
MPDKKEQEQQILTEDGTLSAFGIDKDETEIKISKKESK